MKILTICKIEINLKHDEIREGQADLNLILEKINDWIVSYDYFGYDTPGHAPILFEKIKTIIEIDE